MIVANNIHRTVCEDLIYIFFLSTTVIKTGNNYTCASPLHFWINIHFLEASRFSVTYYTYRDFFLSL